MSAEKCKQLLAEYKSIKEREVEILVELFDSHLELSDSYILQLRANHKLIQVNIPRVYHIGL